MYTVKYGRDRDKYRYTHINTKDLEEAKRSADSWQAGWPKEMKVWVEENGEVIYGKKPNN